MWFRKVVMRLSEVWGVHRSGMLIRQRMSMPVHTSLIPLVRSLPHQEHTVSMYRMIVLHFCLRFTEDTPVNVTETSF